MTVSRIRTVVLAAALTLVCAGPAATEPPEPLELGLEEGIDVKLVLVDFLVHDRQDRTVPDLTLDDFVVVVSGREMELDSLDVDCPAGAAEDPRPGKASVPLPDGPTTQPRRILLVFDYYHMENAANAIASALAALDKWPVGDEEHMVVSFGETVRVESPFTTDLEQTRQALQRMRDDLDLYAGHYGHLTERRFFRRMAAVFDLLELLPGHKVIVLFSGPFVPDGYPHDLEFKELSAMSAVARTAVYPVDTGGLRVPTDPLDTGVAGPLELRRLANETGGRMTTHTNEVGLAYAKAHRDLSCTYTLGFYDDRPREDRERRFTIRVKDRTGLRVVYPEYYMFRSSGEKRKSLFRTAAVAPGAFDSDRVATDLLVMGPRSKRRWNALMAIEIRLGPDTIVADGERWPLRGIVRKPNGTIVHSFRRKIDMPESRPDGARYPAIKVFHEVRVRPGIYTVSAVLSNPEEEMPLAATRTTVISDVPQGAPFLIGPILGLRAEPDPESSSREPEGPAFEPFVTAEADRGDLLDSLTLICAVGPDSQVDLPSVARRVVSIEGTGGMQFDPVSARLAGKRDVECHEQLDSVATASLDPGLYEMSVVVETSDAVLGQSAVEFTIRPASSE